MDWALESYALGKYFSTYPQCVRGDLAVVSAAASFELAAAGIVAGVDLCEVPEPHLVIQQIYFPPICHLLWCDTQRR